MTQITGEWLLRGSTQRALGMLCDAGYAGFVVGGCVRNALMGLATGDIDIATDARPERVLDLAQAAQIKAVPTGLQHGTITLVIDGIGYEITTFRADVETDGRHAVVRFSDDMVTDARRRDFTMNALYADAQGRVHDPLGGLQDVHARRLRFIDDPVQRITEDYLRTLRYFRFFAWYCDPADGFDPDALSAIGETLDGLAGLSRERVGAEMVKLLTAPDPAPALGVMDQTGVLSAVLPGADMRSVAPLVQMEGTLGLSPDPMRRLAVMGAAEPDSLRLSKAQMRQVDLLLHLAGDPMPLVEIAYRYNLATALSVHAIRAPVMAEDLDMPRLSRAAKAQFPCRASDLPSHLKGPEIGQSLKQLETLWIASDFDLGKSDLLSRLSKG